GSPRSRGSLSPSTLRNAGEEIEAVLHPRSFRRSNPQDRKDRPSPSPIEGPSVRRRILIESGGSAASSGRSDRDGGLLDNAAAVSKSRGKDARSNPIQPLDPREPERPQGRPMSWRRLESRAIEPNPGRACRAA